MKSRVNHKSRSRGGRPRKSESERRTHHQYTVKVNKAEREVIEAKAVKVGMAPSVYLRQASVGAKLGVARSNVIYHRLSRIGFKVKQLAADAERTGQAEEQERLEAIMEDIRQLLNEL